MIEHMIEHIIIDDPDAGPVHCFREGTPVSCVVAVSSPGISCSFDAKNFDGVIMWMSEAAFRGARRGSIVDLAIRTHRALAKGER